MALEAGDGFISGLVVTNPVNATDQLAQGDDHIRLIKTALKGTFPNLNAAVTSSPAELNLLDGVTATTAELNIVDGVTLTAAQINDAARKSVNNTFTGAIQTIAAADALVRVQAAAATVTTYMRALDAGSGILGTSTNHPLDIYTNDLSRINISNGGNFDFKAGTVTTSNASASEVGYKGAPQNVQDGNYTLVLSDAGKSIDKQSGGAGETITIPANASVAFPIGTVISGDNDGGGTLTIAITSDTLEDTAGNTGSRTVADNGCWAIRKIAATKWRITGSGIS